MYEIDFTRWTRTPEDIAELKANNWKRRKFHLRRLLLAIRHKRWWTIKDNVEFLFTNTKSI